MVTFTRISSLAGFCDQQQGELNSIFTTCFGKSTADVAFNGANAENQAVCNCFIAQTLLKQISNTLFR